MSPDCDLNYRSDHVWEIILDLPASDDFEDDEVDDTETNTKDKLDDTLSLYNVAKLQSSCPDCRVFLNYFRDEIFTFGRRQCSKDCLSC